VEESTKETKAKADAGGDLESSMVTFGSNCFPKTVVLLPTPSRHNKSRRLMFHFLDAAKEDQK
jgi:hypothetical protein